MAGSGVLPAPKEMRGPGSSCGGEQRAFVPVTMVPFRREDAAFVKGARGVQGVLTYSSQVSQALQELLVLWAAARGQDTTAQNPLGAPHSFPTSGPKLGHCGCSTKEESEG